jgi:hypothetical protein
MAKWRLPAELLVWITHLSQPLSDFESEQAVTTGTEGRMWGGSRATLCRKGTRPPFRLLVVS